MELLLPLLVLLLLVPLFLSVRRQKKEVDRQRSLQDALTIGDRVMTTSGMYGDVVAIADTTVDLEIAPGVVTTWLRVVVRDIVTEDTDELSDTFEQAGTDDSSAGPGSPEGNAPEGFNQRGPEPGR
ncbi:preprotein translocase subunit YajC [Hoyosella subflava]|uniref:Preprotein translocase, YajC subunit n=1 Tax=Hoyosella subflava (strain DSM 45089 / JCM 17490 / NBRC 109087 / DQS3-9A1) TaxID=443218 RepID=F6ELL6_HOYSD|nr:preprotein translocase subunit YajC [Hoyosella subflava]AEF40266.1 Preprotein translocase, YajC subunit [Hoyosella subflava DQS3-9A1]